MQPYVEPYWLENPGVYSGTAEPLCSRLSRILCKSLFREESVQIFV